MILSCPIREVLSVVPAKESQRSHLAGKGLSGASTRHRSVKVQLSPQGGSDLLLHFSPKTTKVKCVGGSLLTPVELLHKLFNFNRTLVCSGPSSDSLKVLSHVYSVSCWWRHETVDPSG